MITFYDSPVGPLRIESDGESIKVCAFAQTFENTNCECPVIAECVNELEAYFAGTLTEFNVKLKPAGTDFQKRVWDALRKIPYGETASYKKIAEAVGNPKACRAVGSANHENPIVILIPCHRVVGSDGKLTGYGGGLDKKKFLLDREKRKR